HQVDAFKKVLEMYKTNFGTMNTAKMGTGKTYMEIVKASYYRFYLFAVVPAGAVDTWKEMLQDLSIEHTIISYSSLVRSKHDYLIRDNGKFYATNVFRKLVDKKMLLVFDENQFAKNPKSLNCKACHALAKEVVRVNNGSRISLDSATPVDMEPFVESVLKLAGVITMDDLFVYNPGNKTYDLQGYAQLVQYCNQLNPKLTADLQHTYMKAGTIRSSMYQLYVQIAKYGFVYTMPKPIINSKFYGTSTFMMMDPVDLKKLNAGLTELKDAVNYKDDGTVVYNKDGIAKVIKSMVMMEDAKINMFYKVVENTLEYVQNSKVILYVWHNDTVDILMNKLSK